MQGVLKPSDILRRQFSLLLGLASHEGRALIAVPLTPAQC